MRAAVRALGRLPAGTMNRLEARYARHLEEEQRAGRVLWWKFEGIKVRLADKTFYTPDFAVLLADGTVEFHEIKGQWRDDARVKIKVAAEQYPLFVFRGVQAEAKVRGGGWKVETFGAWA